MHIIACIDERNGMLFNRRRVSSDSELTHRITDLAAERKLWMNSYSAKLFSERTEWIAVSDDFLNLAGEGEYCFAETGELLTVADRIESVTLCCWNRKYPADVYFPEELLQGRNLVFTEEFPGNSHEKITLVRYE